MLHEPAAQDSGPDHATAFKTRLGVILCLVYASIYCGFVAISVFDVKLMEKTVFAGLNLAVVYGFGLIIFALLLAVAYNHVCTQKEKELNIEAPKATHDAKNGEGK